MEEVKNKKVTLVLNKRSGSSNKNKSYFTYKNHRLFKFTVSYGGMGWKYTQILEMLK